MSGNNYTQDSQITRSKSELGLQLSYVIESTLSLLIIAGRLDASPHFARRDGRPRSLFMPSKFISA